MTITDNIYSGEQIANELQNAVHELVQWVSEQEEDRFHIHVNEKWSSAGQIEHLIKSSKPLAMVLGKPKFIMRMIVGKPNRPSRTYDQVVEKYLHKIATTKVSTKRFFPSINDEKSKRAVINRYLAITEKLVKVIRKYSEADLDNYILPHPLLGKLTVREMMFFTIYHTQHHFKSIQQLYGK